MIPSFARVEECGQDTGLYTCILVFTVRLMAHTLLCSFGVTVAALLVLELIPGLRKVLTDSGLQEFKSVNNVELLTSYVYARGGGVSSIPNHFSLFFANLEAKSIARESEAVNQPLQWFFGVRCEGSIIGKEDLPDGDIDMHDLGLAS